MTQSIVAHICGQNGNHFHKNLQELGLYKHGHRIDSLFDDVVDDTTAEFMLDHIAQAIYLDHGLDYCLMFLRLLMAHELFMYLATGKYNIYLVNRCSLLMYQCKRLKRGRNIICF